MDFKSKALQLRPGLQKSRAGPGGRSATKKTELGVCLHQFSQLTQDLWELELPPGLSPILFIPYSLKQQRQVVKAGM